MKKILFSLVLAVIVYGCSSPSNPTNPSSAHSLTFSKIIVELDTVLMEVDNRNWLYDLSQNQNKSQDDSGAITVVETDTLFSFAHDTTVTLGQAPITIALNSKNGEYLIYSFSADPQAGMIRVVSIDKGSHTLPQGNTRVDVMWSLHLGNIPYTIDKHGQIYAEVVPNPSTPFLGTYSNSNTQATGESYSSGTSFTMKRILAPTANAKIIIRSE